MNITSTTVIRHGEYHTGNAGYRIEYVVLDSKLTRIQANVYEPMDGEEKYLGVISFENGAVSCSLPVPENCSLKDYFGDFEIIMNKIEAESEGRPGK
ncbi:hypothetical protein [Dysgonomonas termitidis]|uniref:Uncharacterized protein n=1 Tax=Dysgonomonas termitidis TaxID=1516126 RepID=A0ABV9KQ90_9BACT